MPIPALLRPHPEHPLAANPRPPTRRLREVREEDILAAILPGFRQGAEVLVPPGDDAAVLATSGSVVASTDSMVRGRDWRDDWSSGADVGRKLMAQNVADIAAMGALPRGVLVSLMADPETELSWVEDFSAGVAAGAEEAQCSVIGGDLSSAGPGTLVVSLTILGDLGGRPPVLRSGARVGDVVAVCGTLGWSGAGLATYAAAPVGEKGRRAQSAEVRQAVEAVREVHRAPRPPWRSGPLAAAAGASAMIDLSDGLVRDARRVAAASGVRIELSGEALREGYLQPPLTRALPEEQAWEQILSGGEEHSLLATFPPGRVPPERETPWRVIGRCLPAEGGEGGDGTAAREGLVTVDGIPPSVSGWDHFLAR